ncbi:SAM-dependent methyltransferase [Chelatococcus reniformis]|uniref:Cyclopropane-fatty-acyl-phospholipid synthase n=1 Tax=Chelatococcus reniformis TaxID=1494448 RepID=A0A916TYU9_9HYPH|nr:cyclopropane-fatty-acyl-phospholipid synthase family protein [Chelatococcus reniformis]GGC50405.1 cyclopropane-fatty-acyl-phospholipid synthase [Chelatococcus reniformis]
MADKRLATLKKLLAHVHKEMGLEFGFYLWDGSTVPATLAPGALGVWLGDEGAVASLIRRPNAETLSNLWASGRLDIRNGTIFDMVEKKPKVRTRDFRKSLNRLLALRTASKFLFVSRGGPWPLEEISEEKPSSGDAAENKKNIGYHYDVSNAFYELWLDPEMVYTCSYYTDWDNSLAQSQLDKLEMVCRRLRLKPGESVLDMGCGWGAFSIYAAKHYGVKTYGVTLSEQQVAYANDKIKRLGLSDQCTIELKDFAHVEGHDRFDKVAAIGMIEHVGLANFPTYFGTVHRVLKPGGLFLHHGIVRPGKHATKKKKRAEFAALTKYIFPGGELDSISGNLTALERHGFEVHDVEGWREHYMRTCRQWHDRLYENREAAIREVGEVKYRIWLMYLGACSISFDRNNVGLYQTLASKRVRGSVGLPPSRADLYREPWQYKGRAPDQAS